MKKLNKKEKKFVKILEKKGKYVIGENTKWDDQINSLEAKGVIEFNSHYDDTVNLKKVQK